MNSDRGSPIVERRVLLLGVCHTDRVNLAAHISAEVGRSSFHLHQRWIALGESSAPGSIDARMVHHVHEPTPPFLLLNQLVQETDLSRLDFILVTDDQVELPPRFLDSFMNRVIRCGFSLAQPARTHDSYIDHGVVEQVDGLEARQTRFVERSPFLCIRQDAFPLILPFDESSPEGRGYEYVWPLAIERAGLSMGIIDASPVACRLRPAVSNTDWILAGAQEEAFLNSHAHISRADAATILAALT